MAWMFAGTEHDMVVGIHFHLHNMIVPPPVVTVPFTPSIHPALAQLDDKLARTVKVDNRKAARTGSKASVNIPPHLPIIYFAGIGPVMAGSFKDKDQMFMGVGLGVHPLGGIGFVTIEGKPAVGMLCMSMSCMSCGPVEMMIPAMPNFLLIPTRMPTVLYGLLPLALDLLVILIAMIENLLDWLLDKLPDGILKDILNVAKDAFIASLEVFCEAMFESDPPKSFGEALSMAGKAFAYEFVDGMVELATDKLCGAIGDSLGPVGSLLWNFVGESIVTDAIDGAKEDAMNAITGGDYGEYQAWKDAAKADEDTNPLGPIVDVCAVGADISNGWANDFAGAQGGRYTNQQGEETGGPDGGRYTQAGQDGHRAEQNALYNNRGNDFLNHAGNDIGDRVVSSAGENFLGAMSGGGDAPAEAESQGNWFGRQDAVDAQAMDAQLNAQLGPGAN